MSRSLIQTANTSNQSLTEGSTIGLGTTIRRFGCNCRQNGDAIETNGMGYYTVSGTVTAEATVAGDISVGIFQNNVPVPGGTSTVTAGAVGDKVTIPVQTTIKQGCDCEGASNITLRLLDNDADIINVSLEVDKK